MTTLMTEHFGIELGSEGLGGSVGSRDLEEMFERVTRAMARAQEPIGRSDTSLAVRATEVEVEIATLEAERLEIAAELDARRHDGAVHSVDGELTSNPFWGPTTGKWLAAANRQNEYRTIRWVSDGTALRSLPEIQHAFGAGRISSAHVARMLTVFRKVPDIAVEAQATMIDWALTMQWPTFTAAIDALIEVTDPTDPVERAKRAKAKRGLWWTAFDGVVEVRAVLTAEQFDQWLAVLRPMAERMFREDHRALVEEQGEDAPLEALARTSPQRLVDAATEAIRRGAGADDPGTSVELGIGTDLATFDRELERLATGKAPELSVEEALAAAETFRCHSDNGLAMNPALALAAGITGRLRRYVFHLADAGVDVSVSGRFFRGLSRKAVDARDPFCATPGCGVLAVDCEVDHVVPASRGGLTVTSNGENKCGVCHRWKTLLELLDKP